MAQQHLNFGTAAANDGEFLPTAFQKMEDNFNELYGATPRVFVEGISDSLVPNDSGASAKAANKMRIQAAIDFAHANAKQVVNLSAGQVWSDPGLYLDAPGNLRTNEAVPTIFSFSLHLKGAGGLGNNNGHGTQLKFSDNTTKALVVGTGQGMKVSGLSIIGPGGASSRAALPGNGIGVALAGGSGGLSRARIDDVLVDGFRRAYMSGFNANQLCDSVTYFKSVARNCYEGWVYGQTQNYINDQFACTGDNNTIHVSSPLGKAVNVIGGNYSGTSANKNAFTIGSTSALTAFTDGYFGNGFTNWSFTTTLAADDQPMRDGAYNAFVIKTTSFGLVPLELTAYSPGTRVATFKLYRGWVTSHFWGFTVDLKADTALETELQAATTLYAAEMMTLFQGSGINATGVHFENPGVVTRLLDTTAGFTGDRVSRIDKAFANYDINQASLANGTEAQKAVHYCQLVFPFVYASSVGAVLQDSRLDQSSGSRGINIEVVSSFDRLISRNCDLDNPNIVVSVPSFGAAEATAAYTQSKGGGDWDNSPFFASADAGAKYYAKDKLLGGPFKGFSPAHGTTPRLTAAQLTAVSGVLGALGTYPALCGDAIYSVISGNTTLARSKHTGWSYGQSITVNWSAKGQTHVLGLSDVSRMFAGLVLTLNVDGTGNQTYVVTGVYPTLGYVTVRGISRNLFAGLKTTTFTGSSVGQEVYTIITIAGV